MQSSPKRQKTGDNILNLLSQSRGKNSFSEVLELLKEESFESPFLKMGRIASEESAIKEAKELLEEIKQIIVQGNPQGAEVVKLLFKNAQGLGGGNVLHGLVTGMAFEVDGNQMAVFRAILKEENLRADLLNQEDEQKATPLEYAKTHIVGDIFLAALDLEIDQTKYLNGILTIAMREKNHALVAAIYNHPNFKITADEQIMYLVYQHKFLEEYPDLSDEIRFKDERGIEEKRETIHSVSWSRRIMYDVNSARKSTSNYEITDLIKVYDKLLTEQIRFISQALIEKGEAFEKTFEGYLKENPLTICLDLGYMEAAKALVRDGAKFGTKHEEYIGDFDIELLDMYLKQEQNSQKNKYFNTEDKLLHIFSWSGNAEVIRALMARGAKVYETYEYGLTPLHLAAYNGSESAVSALIAAGAEIDKPDERGLTPLHLAAYNGSESTVSALIAAGAEINKTDERGLTPLHILLKTSDFFFKFSVFNDSLNHRRLRSKGKVSEFGRSKLNSLSTQNENNKINLIKILLEKGADVNAPDKDGKTPLHLAIECKDTALIKLLLEKGADVNVPYKDGKTPLHIAMSSKNLSFALVLLAYGANLYVEDSQGLTPLDEAKSAPNVRAILIATSEAYKKIMSMRTQEITMQEASLSSSSLSQTGGSTIGEGTAQQYSTNPEEQKIIDSILKINPNIGRENKDKSRE